MEKQIIDEIEFYVQQPSWYPEKERKSEAVRRQELKDWYEQYHEVNKGYNLYGMDLADSEPLSHWLDQGVFRKQRHDLQAFFFPSSSRYAENYTTIMRDKMVFEMFAQYVTGREKQFCRSLAALTCDDFLAMDSEDGIYTFRKGEEIDAFFKKYAGSSMILKQAVGTGGHEIAKIGIEADGVVLEGKKYGFQEFISEIAESNTTWLFQPVIRQHPFFASFNESSVNTIRIVTFNTGKRALVQCAIIRFGKPGMLTDNASSGGYIVGINDDGTVCETMFHRADGPFACPMAGQKVPFYEETKALVLKLHRMVPQIFSVGWDVAVTEEGPVVIEGNDGWDPDIMQMTHGPLRLRWEELLAERKGYFKR